MTYLAIISEEVINLVNDTVIYEEHKGLIF